MTNERNDHGTPRVGQVKEVTSLANPIIKDIRALAQKKHRDDTRSFMAEGLKLVIDAFDLGWRIKTLVYAKAAKGKPQVEQVAAKTVAKGGLVLEVSEKVISTITRRDNPQMVVGIFEQRYRALKDIRPQEGETYVALDRVRDPGNLGTIIRTADAAGASGIILVGETTDPFSLETVRATMGSVFAMPIVRASAEDFIAWQKAAGVRVVATHLAGSVDYRTIDYKSKPVVLLMGNEQAGLPVELAREAGALVPGCRLMIESKTLFSRPLPIAIFILVALAADQLLKYLVEVFLPFQEAVPVIPMLALYRTYNYGVAFSMLSGMEGWFIVGIRLAVVGFVLWLWRRTPKDRFFAHLGYAMIIAGALGNLVDRLLFGYVIDYILFHTATWSFAVFNLADSFITIGAGAIILDELLQAKKARSLKL
jgi:TrmH family RNA methyltransferase